MRSSVQTDEKSKADRFDGKGDDIVRQFIDPRFLALNSEEYAARQAHNWGLLSFHRYRFRDPTLAQWVRRFAEIFADGDELERCRQKYSTAEELAVVRKEEKEEL